MGPTTGRMNHESPPTAAPLPFLPLPPFLSLVSSSTEATAPPWALLATVVHCLTSSARYLSLGELRERLIATLSALSAASARFSWPEDESPCATLSCAEAA